MKKIFTLILIFATVIVVAQKPVSPDASKEAKALLDLFYRTSGKYTFTGQHNYPATKDRNSRFAAKYIGQTPAIWSSDMGFAKAGDTDSYLARPDIVKEAIRQHKKESIITICWHAVPPTADEPVTFQPDRNNPAPPGKLASVQGQLLDQQFKDILTPGTELYKKWEAQVDSVAVYLKQLRDAHVPVLWRPYHEMNGDWFWWGGRVVENSTAALYRQLFDRYTKVHNLNNLVWVWSVDRPSTPIRKFSNFYPGNDYLDILALDVYGSDFNQAYYDSLMSLSKGKPIVLGEVGNPPTLDILDKQPNWGYWVIWAGMVRNLTKKEHQVLVNDPRMLSQKDPTYWEVMNPYREACGLPKLPLKPKYPVNFSENWILNEEKSDAPGMGNSAYKMEIDHDDDLIYITRYSIVEWGNDRITNDEILLNGSETVSQFFNSPRISVASWDNDSKSVKINTTMKFNRGGQSREIKSSEEWKLNDSGDELTITSASPNFRGGGERKTVQVFEKE